MYSEERRRQIASLTAVEGRVNVTELAARFDVTAETIRRDLAVLDREDPNTTQQNTSHKSSSANP